MVFEKGERHREGKRQIERHLWAGWVAVDACKEVFSFSSALDTSPFSC